ncbi:mechanosensitive ion channel family protein [Nitrosophilus labii]|uniref:mechanosensitive ion channel family protein n=1 Tax=Nitrosophilus labii TaxID=2706014 RepID=UPI001FE78AA4|nr:mechanosensitive ion channel family protein [Nitrosophilus labii]
MKKIFLIISLLITFIKAADLNTTLLKDNNTSAIYKNILKSLKTSDNPETALQKTLIVKILNIKKEGIKSFDIYNYKVSNQKNFIDTFFTIVEKIAEAKRYKKSLSQLKEQLSDIEEDISKLDSNATNLLTLQLEYAYYYKKYDKIKKDIEKVETLYEVWLKQLLKYLPKIEFKTTNNNKSVKELQKKILQIDKKIKKLEIEKERWRILDKKRYVENLEKEIQRLTNLKDSYIKKEIKSQLLLFFKALKQKSEKVFQLKIDILETASKFSSKNVDIKDALNEALNIFIESRLGKTTTYIYQLKENAMFFLTQNRFFNIPLYKIVAGIGIFLLFLFLRKLFVLIVLKILKKMSEKTKSSLDDKVLAIVTEPLKFAFIIVGFYLSVKVMDIDSETVDKIVRSMVIVAIFWLFFDAVSVLEKTIFNFAKKFGKELYREIGNFFIKTLKIFIFSVGLVAVLQEWNINVSAFIASLGLGGLAFALAAKDTAANLFGGLTILADKSLKIDDWIKVQDVEGTVEDIGLRTIKVRTFEKSLVTVPNQIVANNPIENFSRRDIRRIKMRVGLTYSTTKEQMDEILKNIRNMLKSHPRIDKKATMLVNFDEFQDSSLSIFIYCFTNTANWQKYLEIKEDVNLKIMDIVESAGAEFAFPSQSIYVEKIVK